MHPDIAELRPKLKEILYDCAVDMKATKAALFLLDAATRKYELVTEFGFRSTIRQTAGTNDPLVDRCSRARSPFFVNTPGADPRLSELFLETESERLLAVPLLSRGQLIGLIDIRDKRQKQPFDQNDVNVAQSIGDRMLGLFVNKNIWNQRFITLSDAETPIPVEQIRDRFPGDTRPHPVHVEEAPPTPSSNGEPSAEKVVESARSAVSRLLAPVAAETIGPELLPAIREGLRSILLLPGAVVAVFTGHGIQEIASRGTITQDALSALNLKLQGWLNKRGESIGSVKTSMHTPLGLTMAPVALSHLQKIFTAAVNTRFRGVYLTVAFQQPPEKGTHELLSAQLAHMEAAIEWSSARAALQATRLRAAERLVEPEFTSYPELRRHSTATADLTEQFTSFLGLTGQEAEALKLVALVHDCGMRLLDYRKLYRKRDLTHDELAVLREHPIVSAALVEPLLGPEIARAVLCHHERVDGSGYPNGLRGDDIPLASRIVQICDVYIAVTDPETYHAPDTAENALASIRRGAGAQFDKELALRFDEMMRVREPSPREAGRGWPKAG